jgi:TIGR03009 family protein
MCFTARHRFLAIVFVLSVIADATGQQPAPDQQGARPKVAQQQPAAVGQAVVQPPAAPQPPQGFQLNQLQATQLNTVLTAWQQNNAAINTFSCAFDRLEYDNVFGPPKTKDGREVPLYKNVGELSYSRPDKGSFQITETKKWQDAPVQPGQPPNAEKTGDWIKQSDAIGDHWVCDGKSVYQYRPDLRQLVEHPIPPQLQGQAIVDGPLPFLVGADANKLKQRYWMKLDQQQNQDPNEIWIIALPKFQAQAADFTEVDVVLDRQSLLPKYMRVWMPNRSHHVYIFHQDSVKKNSPFALLQGLFQRPSIPFGWKRVVEDMPLQQAAQPQPQPPPR